MAQTVLTDETQAARLRIGLGDFAGVRVLVHCGFAGLGVLARDNDIRPQAPQRIAGPKA